VLLIDSLQDGMNLVAKEWSIISKRPGVLVVSETAGALRAAGRNHTRPAHLANRAARLGRKRVLL